MRDIATRAGSDPAVVIRHFGTKEKLFLEVVPVAPHFRALTEGPLETLGRSILDRLVGSGDSTLRVLATALGALDRPEVHHYLEQTTVRNIVEPLAARLSGPRAGLRAYLVAAQIGGLLLAVDLFASAPVELADAEALDCYAEAIQALIDDPAADRA